MNESILLQQLMKVSVLFKENFIPCCFLSLKTLPTLSDWNIYFSLQRCIKRNIKRVKTLVHHRRKKNILELIFLLNSDKENW